MNMSLAFTAVVYYYTPLKRASKNRPYSSLLLAKNIRGWRKPGLVIFLPPIVNGTEREWEYDDDFSPALTATATSPW